MRIISLLILFCPVFSFSQNKQIDGVIREISFEKDTIRAVFEWVANNIEYDVEKYRFKSKIKPLLNQSDEEKINTTLHTKKGVCEDYALVFNSLCRILGYESYLVNGYTKDLKSVADDGHAWNVIKIKGKWYCFDPTWASGRVSQNVFYKEFSDIWFKVPPNEFIFTHVPYDPIWQLTEYPIIAKINNINLPTNDCFKFEDSIAIYNNSKSIEFLQNLINRVSKYNESNDNINQYIKFLTDNLNIERYKLGIEKFNYVVSTYSTYIFSKNKQFRNPKLKDSEIQNLLSSAEKNLNESNSIFENLNFRDPNEKVKVLQQINQMGNNLKNEIYYFQKYKKIKSPFMRILYRPF